MHQVVHNLLLEVKRTYHTRGGGIKGGYDWDGGGELGGGVGRRGQVVLVLGC